MAVNKAIKKKTVETLTHDEARRKNIPTAEFQSVMRKEYFVHGVDSSPGFRSSGGFVFACLCRTWQTGQLVRLRRTAGFSTRVFVLVASTSRCRFAITSCLKRLVRAKNSSNSGSTRVTP